MEFSRTCSYGDKIKSNNEYKSTRSFECAFIKRNNLHINFMGASVPVSTLNFRSNRFGHQYTLIYNHNSANNENWFIGLNNKITSVD